MTHRDRPDGTSETDELIAEAITAWRPRSSHGEILPHPAWADLDAPARRLLFDETRRSRILEAALDEDGLTTTGRAVIARITGGW